MKKNRKADIIVFVRRMLISTALYFAIALPFRLLFSLIPGVTEIRPANMIPPVFGLLWGMPAAVGITLGNLISDIISGSNFFICLTGALTNFLFAYLPFKMWYAFAGRKGTVRIPSLDKVSSIIQYIVVIFLDSVVVTTLLVLIFEAAGYSSAADNFMLLFYNNFCFSVILGVPLIMQLTVSKRFSVQFPSNRKRKVPQWTRVIGFGAAIAVGALGIVYLIISVSCGGVIHSNPAFVLMVVSMVLLYASLFTLNPSEFQGSDDSNLGFQGQHVIRAYSIKAKITAAFLTIAVAFIVILLLVMYSLLTRTANLPRLTLWSTMYTFAGGAISIIFAITLVFLWFLEKNITSPLEKMTKLVGLFAASDHSGSEQDAELTALCDSIHSGDEMELLATSFRQMMDDIRGYVNNITRITAEKERIGAELNVATRIQADMLPTDFLHTDSIELYATMTPAKEVGGDFYDFFMIDDDHLGLVMADVSGKGVPAALFMVISKTMLQNRAMRGGSPADILTDVNKQLCVNNKEEMFVTCWLGILEISTGKLTASSAGHEYPVLCHDGDFELYKDKHGFVLAGMDMARYKAYELTMAPGDYLYVYTDGVAEATSADNELFGTDRMLAALNAVRDPDCETVLHAVKQGIDVFVKDAPQFDDITMMCVRYKGGKQNG